MFNNVEYRKLKKKYGQYASWAIWSHKEPKDTKIIDECFDQLHSKFILLGLNISRPIKHPWSNFHDNSHARKLKYASNDTKLRGSYITDIFKGIDEPSSKEFEKSLTDKVIADNVKSFKKEMEAIKINDDSQFIVFGRPSSLLARCFSKDFGHDYKNRVTYYHHYAYYGFRDEAWVDGLWEKLNIKQDSALTINNYRKQLWKIE